MEFGYPYHDRIEALSNAEQNGTDVMKVEFRGQTERLPEKRVPIGLPRYRLNNGRTGAGQAEHIAEHSLSEDFFTADSEQDHVQEAQHEILTQLTEGAGLLEHFRETSTRQTEPLILTHEGIVANGNRRLCAMRNLLDEDPSAYSHFTHINVVVLPRAEEKDIVRLEANLQLKRDIKFDYGWVSKIILLRKAEALGMNLNEAASLYEFKDEKEALRMLRTLDVAENYLHVRGMSNQYSKISEDQYAFEEMEKLEKKQRTWDFSKRMKFTQLSFACIDDSSRLGGRVMSQIRSIHDNIDTLIEELEEDHSESLVIEASDEDGSTGDMDLLGGGTSSGVTEWQEITSDNEDTEEIFDTIKNTIQREDSRRKAAASKNFVLAKVRDVDKILTNAVKNKKSDMSKDGVMERINSIETHLREIKEWVQND